MQRNLFKIFAFAMILALTLSALPAPRAVQAAEPVELFFSEYIEGSSNNKALEIYNGTGAAVDLAAGRIVDANFNRAREGLRVIEAIRRAGVGDNRGPEAKPASRA